MCHITDQIVCYITDDQMMCYITTDQMNVLYNITYRVLYIRSGVI